MPLPSPIKTLSFEKWEGAGNDFILVDNANFNPAWVARLCHRRFGIGADGVIWFLPPSHMRIFNADGSEASCCGNALRCLAKAKNLIRINNRYHVKPVKNELAISMGIPKFLTDTLIDTGVLHLVVFNGDFSDAEELRKKHDANVNFAKIIAPGRIAIRTYEKGVEGETYSCGTGAVAVCSYARRFLDQDGPFTLCYSSGDELKVFFERSYAWLQGQAFLVFKGEVDVNWDSQRDQNLRISRWGNTSFCKDAHRLGSSSPH